MKTVKCPICHKEIDYLVDEEYGTSEYEIRFDDKGKIVSKQTGQDLEEENYYCPKCDAPLFTSYEDAVGFLNGEEIRKDGDTYVLGNGEEDEE